MASPDLLDAPRCRGHLPTPNHTKRTYGRRCLDPDPCRTYVGPGNSSPDIFTTGLGIRQPPCAEADGTGGTKAATARTALIAVVGSASAGRDCQAKSMT